MTSFNANTATPSTVSELVSTTKDSKMQEPLVASIDSGPVQAYAKLEGDDFSYYIRTLQVSLGRKVTNPDAVDIPLGNTKSVSRQHARLFYNFSLQRFELTVFGKNGAFVNEQFIERGQTVPLDNKMKIQIGDMAFVFLLPKADTSTVNSNTKNPTHNNDDNLNYISTPQQLEKTIASIVTSPIVAKTTTQTGAGNTREISDDDDIESETEKNNTSNKGHVKKPPYSYATIIAKAINSTEEKRMTLSGIYNYITTNFPYYQLTENGWQNSIRHNLSLNKAFVKVPRGEAERGKGAFWKIDAEAEPQFAKGIYKKARKYDLVPLSEPAKKRIKKEIERKQMLEQGDEGDEDEEEEVDEIVSDDDVASTGESQDKAADEDATAVNGENVNTVFCA